AIAADGRLTELAGSPFAVGDRPENQAMEPQGRYLFVTGTDLGLVVVFAIDQASGELTHLTSVPAEIQLESIAVHPSGRFLYAGTQISREGLASPPAPAGTRPRTRSRPPAARGQDTCLATGGRTRYVAPTTARARGARRAAPAPGALTPPGSPQGAPATQNV